MLALWCPKRRHLRSSPNKSTWQNTLKTFPFRLHPEDLKYTWKSSSTCLASHAVSYATIKQLSNDAVKDNWCLFIISSPKPSPKGTAPKRHTTICWGDPLKSTVYVIKFPCLAVHKVPSEFSHGNLSQSKEKKDLLPACLSWSLFPVNFNDDKCDRHCKTQQVHFLFSSSHHCQDKYNPEF